MNNGKIIDQDHCLINIINPHKQDLIEIYRELFVKPLKFMDRTKMFRFIDFGNDSQEKDPTIYLVFHIITLLALLGQLFTIFTYRSIKNKNTKFYGYVAIHSVIGLPCTIVNYPIMAYSDNKNICATLGFIFAYCYLAYMFWSAWISWVIYASLKNQTKVKNLKCQYVIYTYAISFLFILYPLLEDRFGVYEGKGVNFCWYDMKKTVDASMWIGYYIPFGVTTALSFYCYISSYLIVKTASKEASQQFYRFIIFPSMQVFCNSGLVIEGVAKLSGIGYTQGFEIVHVVLSKGQGFFEALAYVLNGSVRAEIKKVWCMKRAQGPKLLPPPVVFDEDTISFEINERSQRSFIH